MPVAWPAAAVTEVSQTTGSWSKPRVRWRPMSSGAQRATTPQEIAWSVPLDGDTEHDAQAVRTYFATHRLTA